MMQRAREKFFAGAALAQKQNCRVGGGHSLHDLARFLHGGMFADDARKSVTLGIFLAQEQIFAEQFLLRGGSLEQNLQVIEIDRLLDEIERAFFHGRHRFFDGAVCGNQNHWQRRISAFCLAQDIDS